MFVLLNVQNEVSRSWPALKSRLLNKGLVECFVTKFKSGAKLNCIRLVEEPMQVKGIF